MSDVILDLNGGTDTLTTDTNLYQVTDTSINHNGHLVLQAGVTLSFADTINAGFNPVAALIHVVVSGTSALPSTIRSDNTYPDHRWTLPAITADMDADWCTFANYAGDFQSAWDLTNCTYTVDPYLFCTSAELANLSGTTLTDAIKHEIIAHASNEINARLEVDGITVAQAGDPVLRSVCLNKSMAGVLRRMLMDGTRSGSVNTDGGSGTDVLGAIREVEEKAELELTGYVRNHLPSTRKRLWAFKVNEHG